MPVILDTKLPTARYCCNIKKKAVLPWLNDVDMDCHKLVTCFGVIHLL